MNFKDKLKEILNNIDCSSKELSNKSGISESVISRYRSGERTPKQNSEQLKKLSLALENIIKEKDIKKYRNLNIYEELNSTIEKKDIFDYDNFSKNLNELIIVLKINTNEMAKYINFDASHISRIRYGKTKPSDPVSFCNKVANFIVLKYSDTDSLKSVSLLIGKNITKDNLFIEIVDYLINNLDKKDYIKDFLNNLNNFDLNNYIKAIKFDELKVPCIPLYKAKSRNYYGIEEMKKGELDFFKATVLSKSSEDIFMCSDMPMEDMASDVEFGKKWTFAIAMCLKKGLNLNIIHNLDRPFNEMMLGLESWIPIYMTGQISPFYLKEAKNSAYGHLNYVSGKYALYGECIKGYHNMGKYYLTGNSNEVNYYKNKASFLLKKAKPLMNIYNKKSENLFQAFLLDDIKINCTRKRILNSLPLFTIDDKLLDEILEKNNITEKDIKIIKQYKEKEKNNIEQILKNNKIIDIISELKDDDDIYLSLENIFYDKKIKYTYKEYKAHLKQTIDYKNKNYKLVFNNYSTFNNISITILKDNYVVISKSLNPVIHFVIKHKKLVDAIDCFNPLVKE